MLMVKCGLLPESPHWRTFKWMCHNAWPWAQQLSWWMCQLLFGHLNGLLMELLPLSYQDSRHGSLGSCLELTSTCVLTDITTTPPKAALDLLEQQIAVSTISLWQRHCLLEIQCSRTTPTRQGQTSLFVNKCLMTMTSCAIRCRITSWLLQRTSRSPRKCQKDKKFPLWIFNARRDRHLPLSTSHPYCQRGSRINSLCGFWWHWRICFATILLLEWEASIDNDYAVTN